MAIERRGAERKRRASDHMFQAMFMAMDEGVVSRNGNGEIVAVNPAAENILGLSAAALVGRSSADFARALNFVREDETPFPWELDPATLALQTGKPQRNVLMGAHRPDGTLVWISCNAQPLPSDGESGPYGVVTTFRDVSERKRAEDALSFVAQRGWMASKEKFFDALVKYLGKTLGVDHVLVSTLAEDSGVAETVALYAKGAVVANLRYSLKGTPCEQVMGQRFCFCRCGIQQMFPEDALLATMGADSYAGLPLWDSAGQPIGLIAVLDGKPLRDEALVSQVLQFMAPRAAAELERERNDRILRQSELEFRSLADNMPDNVVRHDRQGRVRYVNPALLASIPAEFSVVVGESLVETFPGNAAKADLHRLIIRVIETGAPAEVEFQLPNLCGEKRIHEVRYVAERDSNGGIVGVLGIGRDITEQRTSERQLRQALEFTQGVINAIPDLLFEADRDGICLNVWARTPELLAVHKEALLGKRFSDVVAPDTAEVALAALREADEKGLSFGKVLRVDLPQGERWFELSVSKKPGSDMPGRFIVLSRDITERKRMETDIRRREREFRSLAENMPDNVVRYDRQARAQYLNPAILASVAPRALPVLGESMENFAGYDAGAAEHHRMIERVIATGEAVEVEVCLPNLRDEMRIHQVRYVAERDVDGEIVGALGIGRDITERKRMEQVVAAREQEFRSLAENSLDSIIRYDRDGRIRYLNSGLLAFFGMSATDIIGRLPREVWPDGRYAEIERASARAAETGEATTVEFDIADAAGVLRSNQVVVVPERDSAGQIIGSLAFGRDVTTLRETERQLRHFIENLPGMAYTFRLSPDGHSHVPYVSPAIKELFGVEPDDVKDDTAPLCELTHPEDRPRIEAATAESARTMTPYRIEYRVCRPDQPERWVDQRCVPEREADGSIIWYGILLDCTERRLAEEYEQFRSRTLELVSGGAPLPVILEGIVRGVEQLKPGMICSILLLDKQGKKLGEGVAPSLPDFYNAAVDGLEIGVGVGCCGTVAATGERVIADDIMTHPYWAHFKELAAKAGLAACWSEPILASSGKVLGTFAVYHRQAHSPAAFDISLIEKSTHLVSIAIERRRAEEALRASELEFRSLAENMPDNVVRYDWQARAQYFNPAMKASLAPGFLPVLGKSPIETFPGNDAVAGYQQAIEQVIATGTPVELEFQAHDPRGEIRDHLVRFVAERDDNGKIVGALAIGQDITEHKRAEEYERFRSQTLELLSRGASLPDILESIVRGVEQLDRERICSILLLDSDGRHFCKGIAPSLPESYNAALDGLEIGVGVGCCGTAAATGKRVIADDLTTHPYWAPYQELVATAGLGACWSEPIRASTGEVLGTFAVYHRHAHSPAPFDIALIEKSTHLVSIAIERRRAEEALRASEREFRTLAENLPDLLIRYDREGRRTYVNLAMERAFGVTAEQLLGKTVREANPTGMTMLETYRRALEHTLGTGERSELEVHVPLPDGSIWTGLCFMVVERAADGRVSGAISITRDITELKRMEDEIRRSEREFRTLAENLPDPLVRYDRIGRRTYVSPVLERAFAVTAESMVGVKARETNPTAMPMRETYLRALEHTLATGERSEFEMQMALPDGNMRTYMCFMVAERASDGQISGAIAVSRDITEHKRTEARLALQARRAEVLLELPDASEAMDEVAFMQRGQELSEELTGSSISFIHFVNEGEDSIDLVTWSRRTLEHYCRASFNKHYPTSEAGIWADALRQRRPVVFNDYAAYPHKRGLPEGHAELTRLISLPVIENGQVVMLAGVGNKPADYTDLDVETVQLIANEIWRIVQRKRTDEQLEEHRCHLERLVESRTQALSAAKEAAEVANRGKSHFLAAASHDLRQPLQAIRLFNDALAMSGLNERQKKIGKALSKSVSSLNELLNDLLDLSRLDAGTIEPQPVAIQAEDLLEAIGLDFDAVCQEKNLRLKLACPQRDLVLFSDENLLLTLLRNLVSNAVKYTKRGGILVGIRRRGDCALIQVWDTGIGIAAELRDSIFEEYFQIDNPERDRTKGVGLGLAIVRRLSKLLGVGVCLYSREGKGSVFEVSVPLARGSDMPASPLPASATLETDMSPRLDGKRIVVIDDDGTAGEAIKLALEMEGAQVILFDTPKDALGSAEVMGADYYISDYRLPGMNGLQLLDAIQKNSVEPIKAVLLTGNVSPDQIASLRSSRWKVVLKPIALAELLAALDVQDAQHRAAGRSWCVTGH